MKGTLTSLVALAALTLLTLPVIAQEQALPAKPPGVIRIGLVKPKVQVGGDASQAAEAVRNILAEYLSGPSMEVALLTARLPSQVAEEARQAQCDYTLSADVSHRRGGDGGMLGKALGNFGGGIPGGNPVQSVIVSGVVRTAADLATSIKAKDEMRLVYRLDKPGAAKAVIEKEIKIRAQSDGEDLLTPLAERAAEAVGGAVSRP